MVEEKVLKLADIIRSHIEQMNAPFSSWPPLPEEVDYHHVKLPKLKIADEFVAIKELSCSRKSGKTVQFVGARYLQFDH